MNPILNQTLIIQFAKAPVLGQVKTRLAPVLDEQQRNELHCSMTTWTCQQLRQVTNHLQLWVAGDCNNRFIQDLKQQQNLEIYSQQGSDLGERMAMAIERGLQQYQRVIIVGSDCPFIDRDYLHNAIKSLLHDDVVIGPAIDGGYVLLGLKNFNPAIFANIPWGTERVLTTTLAAIADNHLTVTLLPTLADIDRPEDLSILAANDLPESIRTFAQFSR
jgi:rSAM/selenodomain-associated transferase 1